jgi:hypothetical protein
MAKDKNQSSKPSQKREPQNIPISAALAGAGNVPDVQTGWFHTVNLDVLPMPAAEWLKAAASRLRASPNDSVRQVSDVARQLEREMYEAMRRGQCDAAWAWGYIKSQLITEGWWPRTRPRR